MSQILGYTGPVSAEQLPDLRAKGYLPDDLLGKAGVEASYETELRGVYGTESVERNALGQKTQVLATDERGEARRLADPHDRHARTRRTPRRP